MVEGRAPLRVVGRYALYKEIAAGGMATVHVGRLLGPVGFARTVAVKRLHPQFAKDPEFVSMFLDEARLAARVQHPNVVATIDVVATDGELFLIMDYVRGESLSKLVRTAKKRDTKVPPRVVAAIMCGFLHGLHAAHEAKNERGEPLGLVHRDVSPQNVLVGADGIPRVLDFGIAKAQGRIQVTRDGQIKGKLAYMPPEQLSGRELTRGVDVYASAVVVWEALTGLRLFKGETEGETLARILRDPVPAVSSVDPSIPRAFDAVLLKALSRDVTKRHATARELAFDLEKCCGVASPSEVGEWVEELVGPILSARENEVAEMEVHSINLRLAPDRAEPESDSESEMLGLPTSGPAGTLVGVGPPSERMLVDARAARKRVAPPTPTAPMRPMRGLMADAVRSSTPSTSSGHGATTTNPGAEGTASRLTGTMMLPMDRKLPILASVAGLVVLLVLTAVVLSGRSDASSEATAAASAAASMKGGSAATASPATTPSGGSASAGAGAGAGAGTTSTTNAIGTSRDSMPEPEPAAPAQGTAASPVPPPAAVPAASLAAAPAPPSHGEGSTSTSPVRGHAHPPPPPVAPPAAAAPAAPKRSCDPPYTIDANGHKKYKLECM